MAQVRWLVPSCLVAILALVAAYMTQVSYASAPQPCLSQPNPIAQQHPDLVSGNINGTTPILPIELSLAREVIPQSYRIMEHKYRELLPSFPEGMYPMVFTAVHDHDIQFPLYNMSLPDFSVGTPSPRDCGHVY